MAFAPPRSHAKVIALSFDDGPDPQNTPKILDVLKRHEVRATFFVRGDRAASNPELVRRACQEGHVVANHTYTHPHLTTHSSLQVEQELRDTNNAIISAGAPRPNLFRPSYGETNATIDRIATSLGLTQVLWDADPADWTNPSVSTICERVVSGVRPGSSVLLHDGFTLNTVDALPCSIGRLRAQGYGFGLIYPSSAYHSRNDGYVKIG